MSYIEFSQLFNGLLLILGGMMIYYSKQVKEKNQVPKMIMDPETMKLCKDVPGFCRELSKWMVIFGGIFAAGGAVLLLAAFVLKVGAGVVSAASTIIVVAAFGAFIKVMSDLTKKYF